MKISQKLSSSIIERTAEVVVAYVSNHRIPISELTNVIAIVGAALEEMGREIPKTVDVAPLVPAVPIKKSVTPDYIICLDDGKRCKFLKRHLSSLGMTPDQYRKKWGLSADYPMVSAKYAARRTEIALSFGFGKKKVAQPDKAASDKPARAREAVIA